MVITTMSKAKLKVSVSDTDSFSSQESEESSNELGNETEDTNRASESSNGEDEDDTLIKNEGWADSIAKILSSSKPKNKKSLVLSRAKKHSETIKKEQDVKPSFEVVGEGEVKEEKPDTKDIDTSVNEPLAKKQKNEKSSIRLKPNILEKDRERLLNKIATKGVVQLFNAVRNQQKTLDNEINRDGIPETKKERILKKFDKRAFLDTLMGQTKSVVVDEVTKTKSEVKSEETPKWSALREDFMMGAKMKDWDKESPEE